MGHITKGNVFEDLGFSRSEAADLAMKVDLACELRNFIVRQNLKNQEKAAEFFGAGPRHVHHQSVTPPINTFNST